MRIDSQIGHFPHESAVGGVESSRPAHVQDSGAKGELESKADVWAVVHTRRQSAPLRRGTEISRVRGYRTREELIRLHVYEGRNLKECARLLGRHYNRVRILWQEIVAKANGDEGVPVEHRAAVRAYVDIHLRRVIEEAAGRISDGAAYGAVVVAGVKALEELHGVKAQEALPTGLSLEDVGREVRVVSPLLLERLDRLRKMNGHVGAQSQPDAPALSLGGVPVEGSVQEPVAAPGAKSPLLEGSAAERMLHELERGADRVVERAQLEGADAVLEAMPVKRKPEEEFKVHGCDSDGCTPSSLDEETENN